MILSSPWHCSLYKANVSRTPITFALLYCSATSLGFVASLYGLVPRQVRLLDRNDPRQIQWRSFATAVVCIVSVGIFPWIFCRNKESQYLRATIRTGRHDVMSCGAVVLHTVLLYFGPILQNLFLVKHSMNQDKNHSGFFRTAYRRNVQPIWMAFRNSTTRWIVLRTLIISPLLEEIVFRGCNVSALATSNLSEGAIVALAPMFFGSAHLHHAYLKYRQGEQLSLIVLQTAFQFAYTSIFGSYVTFALLRTRSVLAVTLSHSFCNAMGVPDLSFARSQSELYGNRYLLWTAHVVGLVMFLATMNRLPRVDL